MKLFYKRPLCLILCIMLGGFCFSASADISAAIVVSSISLLLFVLSFKYKEILFGRNILVRLCLVLLIIAIMLGVLFNYLFFPSEHYDKEVEFDGIIIHAEHSNPSYSTIGIKTHKINGSRDVHKIIIHGKKEALSGINVGDELSAKIHLNTLNTKTKSYYVSVGYSAQGEDLEGVQITAHSTKTLSALFADIRGGIHDRLCHLTDKRTGDFMSALLTGERVIINPALSLSFSRTGTTHILALSGAHLVILAYAVSLVLKIFNMSKRLRTVFTALAVIFYVPLTGMSASVTRAGVMVLISSFIFLLARRSDGPTTLFLSVFLIILFEPYAIYDIALWLSALATLGLLLLSTLLNKRGKKDKLPQRALKAFVSACLASVFAISASMIISILFFDELSVLALPATLVLSVLTELLMYLSLGALLIGEFIPIGRLVLIISELTFDIINWFSRFDYALIPMDFLTVRVLAIILTAVFFYLVFFGSKKHKKTSILTLTVIFLLLNAVGIAQSSIVKNKSCTFFHSGETCNIITVSSAGEYSVIASGGSKDDIYDIIDTVYKDKITKLDNLVLPSYTYYTIDTVKATLSGILVENLMLPTPITNEEYDYALYIAEFVSDFDTRLSFYNNNDKISLGNSSLTVYSHSQPSSPRLYNSFSVSDGEKTALYLSPDCIIYNHSPSTSLLHSADTIIIGGARNGERKTITLMPRSAERVIFGSRFELLPDCEDYLNKKGVSVEFSDTPIKIN